MLQGYPELVQQSAKTTAYFFDVVNFSYFIIVRLVRSAPWQHNKVGENIIRYESGAVMPILVYFGFSMYTTESDYVPYMHKLKASHPSVITIKI